FCTATATTPLSTLSLHDALPICIRATDAPGARDVDHVAADLGAGVDQDRVPLGERALGGIEVKHSGVRTRPDDGAVPGASGPARSEEHTSELQSRFDLVCRLLLE